MKKTLLDSMIGWDAYRKGHIPFWRLTDDGQVLLGHTGDVNFLIESANKYLENDDFKKSTYLHFDHVFGYSLGIWMGRFIDSKCKLNSVLLTDLRDELAEIRFFHTLNPAIPSRGQPLPHWEFTADMEDFSDPATTAAYAFSQQLTLDGLKGLKRCAMVTCKKFFIGRPNAIWCSSKCGGKYRVAKKRKMDKL